MKLIILVTLYFTLLSFVQFAFCLYRELMKAGRDLGVRNVGLHAVDCLRIERVIPKMGSELTSFVTPREAGLMDWVQLNKVWFQRSYYQT